MSQFIEKSGPSALHPVHDVLILEKQAKQSNQVGGHPVSFGKAIGHSQRAT